MAVVPRSRMLATLRLNSGPRRGAPTSSKKVRRGIGAGDHATGGDLLPVREEHPGGGAVFDQDALHLGAGANLGPV